MGLCSQPAERTDAPRAGRLAARIAFHSTTSPLVFALQQLLLTLLIAQAPVARGQTAVSCTWLAWHPTPSPGDQAKLELAAAVASQVCVPPTFLTDLYALPTGNESSSGFRSLSGLCSDGRMIGSPARFNGADTQHLQQSLVHSRQGFTALNGSDDGEGILALGGQLPLSQAGSWTDACPAGMRVSGYQSSTADGVIGSVRMLCAQQSSPVGQQQPLPSAGILPSCGPAGAALGPAVDVLPPGVSPGRPVWLVFAVEWEAPRQVVIQDIALGLWGLQAFGMLDLAPLGQLCISPEDTSRLMANSKTQFGCFQSTVLPRFAQDLAAALQAGTVNGQLQQTLAGMGVPISSARLLSYAVSQDPTDGGNGMDPLIIALPPAPAALPIVLVQNKGDSRVLIAAGCAVAAVLMASIIAVIACLLLWRRRRQQRQQRLSKAATLVSRQRSVSSCQSCQRLGLPLDEKALPEDLTPQPAPLASASGPEGLAELGQAPGGALAAWLLSAQLPDGAQPAPALADWLASPLPAVSEAPLAWGTVLANSAVQDDLPPERKACLKTEGGLDVRGREETCSVDADRRLGSLISTGSGSGTWVPVSKNSSLQMEDWEIQPGDLQLCQRPDGQPVQLGVGGFSRVYKALLNEVTEVAVKQLEANSATKRTLFAREIEIHKRCHSAHVVQFLGACIKSDCMLLVTELMAESLDMVVHDESRPFPWEPQARQIAVDVAQALAYLHKRRVVHLDIKSRNVLLTREGRAKIADVGLSQVMEHTYLSQLDGLGTFAYAAPELLSGGSNCSTKADIWSYGILLHEMVTREPPKRGALCDRNPEQCPHIVDLLIRQCLERDPADRPSAVTIVKTLQADNEAEAERVLFAELRGDSLLTSCVARLPSHTRARSLSRWSSAPLLERCSL